MNKDTNHKVEQAMSSIEGISRAVPQPFLLTRINARLNSNETRGFWYQAAAFIGRPAVALAGLILIFLINAIVISASSEASNTGLANHSITQNEFAINVSSNYDFENQEP